MSLFYGRKSRVTRWMMNTSIAHNADVYIPLIQEITTHFWPSPHADNPLNLPTSTTYCTISSMPFDPCCRMLNDHRSTEIRIQKFLTTNPLKSCSARVAPFLLNYQLATVWMSVQRSRWSVCTTISVQHVSGVAPALMKKKSCQYPFICGMSTACYRQYSGMTRFTIGIFKGAIWRIAHRRILRICSETVGDVVGASSGVMVLDAVGQPC